MRDLPHPLPRRSVPLSVFVSDVKHSVESFPSGDAAQSMIFFATLLAMGMSFYWVILVVLSSTGRVFFHAHHVFDVVAGMLIAITGCSAVISVFKEPIHWFVLMGIVGGGLLYIKVPKYNHGDKKKVSH
jgi:membrane-associated phospholipid phosphatase